MKVCYYDCRTVFTLVRGVIELCCWHDLAENNTNLPHEQFIDERDTNRGDNDSTIQSGFGKIGT